MAEQIEIDIVANDKTTGIIQGIFQGIGQSLANFALQIPGAILNFGKDILQEATDAQLALTDLEATIASTGGVAGVTSEKALELAESLSKVTRFSDDTILAGENMLLTFTNIGEEIFPQATEALLDLATKMKSDLPNAAIQLGKALQDPIAGVTALRRVGVALTDEQEEQIKKFVEMGDIMSAQKVIIEELNKEFGGQAVAAGETFAGQMDIMKNRVNELKEAIGMALIPVLTDFMDRVLTPMMPFIEKIANDFAGWISHIPDMVSGIQPFIDSMMNSVMPLLQDFSNWWSINGGKIIFSAREMWDGMVTGIQDVVTWLVENLSPAFQSLSDWWNADGNKIREAATNLWESMKEGIKTLWEEYLQPFIEEQLPVFLGWWEENGPRIIEIVASIMNALADAIPYIIDLIGALLPFLQALWDMFLGLGEVILKVATGDWAGAWQSMENSMVSALDHMTEGVLNFINLLGGLGNIASGIMASLTSSLAIFPSTLGVFGNALSGMRAGGGDVMQGGSYLVGERGPEVFSPTQNGTIIPNGGIGNNISVTLNYSPSVSLGNRQEAEQTLIPYILEGIRKAQANGLVGVM